MTSAATYLINHIASGIKVGDKVKVLRKAESNERGWASVWNSERMDSLVGSVHSVVGDDQEYGFYLDCSFNFPHFVLEKV